MIDLFDIVLDWLKSNNLYVPYSDYYAREPEILINKHDLSGYLGIVYLYRPHETVCDDYPGDSMKFKNLYLYVYKDSVFAHKTIYASDPKFFKKLKIEIEKVKKGIYDI